MRTLVPSFLVGFVIVFAGNKDNYNILDEFEYQPDSTTDCRI